MDQNVSNDPTIGFWTILTNLFFFFFLFLGEKPLSRKKLVNGSIKVGRVVAQVLTMLTMLTMLRLPPDKTNCCVPIRLFCIQSLDSFLRLPSYFLFWRNAAVAMMWLGDCWLFLVLRDWLSLNPDWPSSTPTIGSSWRVIPKKQNPAKPWTKCVQRNAFLKPFLCFLFILTCCNKHTIIYHNSRSRITNTFHQSWRCRRSPWAQREKL